MDPTFNTSFIPKKSMQIGHGGGTGSQFVKRRTVYGPGFFVSAALFSISVMVSLGVFAYSELTKKSIQEKIAIIVKERDNVLSEKDIKEFERMDNRLTAVRAILTNHVAVSELLYAIEDITYTNVQYTGLAYGVANETSSRGARNTRQTQGSDQSDPALTLKGRAPDYSTVAVQNDQYVRHEAIVRPTVTVLEKEEDTGVVLFGVDATVQPSLVRFGSAVARVGTPVPVGSEGGVNDVPFQNGTEEVVPDTSLFEFSE